ncbi:MAG: DUF1800 domain-containing protein [Planctomycetota bacterium]
MPTTSLSTGTGAVVCPFGHPDLEPWRPSANDPWDRRKAAHLLRRAGFGASDEELDVIVSLGVDRMIDLLLTPDAVPLQAYGVRVLPHGEILDVTSNVTSQRALWLWECVHTVHPLKEKMALFWHNHFSVGVNKGGAENLSVTHVNVFRRSGLGSFRDLLLAVTRDPAMLLWLDNYLNGAVDRGVPKINENYGRELLELYSLGVGNYTQADVVEASKCLSGWGVRDSYGSNEFVYWPEKHVTGPKYVLGRTISNGSSGNEGMQDVFDLVDTILEQPACARFLVEKVWKYFVSSDAPNDVLDDLAQRFRDDAYDVRSLMSIILRSKFFFSGRAIRQLVKNPVEFVVGAIRNLNTPVIESYSLLGDHVALMGLPLHRYLTPAGLPGGLDWLDAQSLLQRANFAEQLTRVQDPYHIKAHFDALHQVYRHNLRTAPEIVDFYVQFLLDGELPRTVRDFCVEFMHRVDWERRPFTFEPTLADRKVRGLVHILLSLPQYSIN